MWLIHNFQSRIHFDRAKFGRNHLHPTCCRQIIFINNIFMKSLKQNQFFIAYQVPHEFAAICLKEMTITIQ